MKTNLTQAKIEAHKLLAERLRKAEEDRRRQVEVEMQHLRNDLTKQIAAGKGAAAVDAMIGVFVSLKQENQELAEKLKAKTIAAYGRQADMLTKEALGQLALALGCTPENAHGAEPTVPAPDEVIAPGDLGLDNDNPGTASDEKKKPKRWRGKGKGIRISASVKRRKLLQLVAQNASVCPSCNHGMRHVAFAVSEKLNYVPGHFEVLEINRQTLGCQSCKQSITTAETNAPMIDVTDAIVASAGISKQPAASSPARPVTEEAVSTPDKGAAVAKTSPDVRDQTPASPWHRAATDKAINALRQGAPPEPSSAEREHSYCRSRVSPDFLAHLIEAKCDDGLPIHRQQKQFAREGVDFPVNTLYDHWNQGLAALDSLAKILLSRVLSSSVVGADDTRFDYLCKDGKRKIARGHFWVFVSEGALVACKFTENWTAQAIEPELSAITGFTQVDDYKGYLTKRQGESESCGLPLVMPMRRLGCMMHVRRRFVRASNGGDVLALTPVQYIDDIYRIEREAKELGLNASDRHLLREAKSKPLLDALYTWIDDKEGTLRPKSPLAVANHYAKQQQLYI